MDTTKIGQASVAHANGFDESNAVHSAFQRDIDNQKFRFAVMQEFDRFARVLRFTANDSSRVRD